MYAKTGKSQDFFDRAGSMSTRILSNGTSPVTPDRNVVDATCKEQLASLRRNQAALLASMRDMSGAEKAKAGAVLDNLRREIGNLAKYIEGNARARFEELFVIVAQHRLPRDAFLVIVQEAREYWRAEGEIANVPEGSLRMKNKWAKRAARRLASPPPR